MRAWVEAPDGARARLAATVAGLRKRAAYPDETRQVETVETHMSFVFLTSQYAYKLKKPIRTALLDYTTIDARRAACETEIELNRRLAPDVYLASVPVVLAGGDVQVGRAGTVIDWLVKMRRLPRDRMFDACIGRKTVRHADVDRIAAVLTRFYAHAQRYPSEGTAYQARLVSDMASKHASLTQPRYGLSQDNLRAAVREQERWIARHAALLQARAALVVDAHGDLRPEHVCLEEAGPVVIDCLEFSQALRLLDPVSELAFLALECRRQGAPWIGDRLLAGYRERSGDDAPPALIPFYQSHHALVRAAVAIWHLDDDALDHSQLWRARANWYLELAREPHS